MFKNEKDLAGEMRSQMLDGARDYFGHSIGVFKGRMEKDRSTLQGLLEQLPDTEEDLRSQFQKLVGSYEDVEYILDRVAEKQRLEETVDQISRQLPANLEDILQRAGETVQPATENLPPGSILLGASADGEDRTVQRSIDEFGIILESTLDADGAPVSENIVGTLADLLSQDERE